MGKIKNIIDGHLKELFNVNKSLSDRRLDICRECPLYEETNIGPICNPNMYVRKSDDSWRYTPAEDYVKGCGCRLLAKTRLEDEHCPAHKWGSEQDN